MSRFLNLLSTEPVVETVPEPVVETVVEESPKPIVTKTSTTKKYTKK